MRLKFWIFTGLFSFATSATAQTEYNDTTGVTDYGQLDEFVIETSRPVMSTDGATLTYNVEEDPSAGSSTVLDILKKVPQVAVDGDGNVRLNGSQDFKFQVNGMDNPMLKQYAGQILQAMPANAVVKIEVITEPGASQDAEGSAGIINIITERTQRQDGYSGSVSLQAANRTLTPSLYGILKKDKVTVSANINYQWGFSPQKGEQSTEAVYLGDGGGTTLKSTIGQKALHHFVGGNLNLSWEPNPDNLFTAGADIFYIDANITSLYGSSAMYMPGGAALWQFEQDGKGNMGILNVSANASFRHNFGRDGNSLILSYLYNFGRTNIWLDRWYTRTENYPVDNPYDSQGSRLFNRGHTVQADYTNDFGSEHHKLEIGAKGIFRHNSAKARYLEGSVEGEFFGVPDLDSYIIQPQDIYAAYASYTGTFGPLSAVGGLRYEHTRMGIDDRYDTSRSFTNHLNDWVPNAALTWSFSVMSNLRLAYQMRISRPSIDQVNPFVLSFSPYEVREGNPDLTSERSHIVSLKYTSFGRAVGGSVGIEYNLADNAISSFTFLRDHEAGSAIVTSYANIGKRQETALTGFLMWTIVNHMTLSIDGRLAYNKLEAPGENYRNHGWSGNIGANWSYTVADVYKFAAYGSWNSRKLSVQGYSPGFYFYGLSVSRDFLADKSLTLSLSANNFLQSEMTFKSYTSTPYINYTSVAKSLSAWNVGVSLTWKFGSLKAQVKKTGVELKNDDINSSSNKGAAGTL